MHCSTNPTVLRHYYLTCLKSRIANLHIDEASLQLKSTRARRFIRPPFCFALETGSIVVENHADCLFWRFPLASNATRAVTLMSLQFSFLNGALFQNKFWYPSLFVFFQRILHLGGLYSLTTISRWEQQRDIRVKSGFSSLIKETTFHWAETAFTCPHASLLHLYIWPGV